VGASATARGGATVASSSTTAPRESGQEEWERSHMSMHSTWNAWPHRQVGTQGSTRAASPAATSAMQMAQSASGYPAPTFCSGAVRYTRPPSRLLLLFRRRHGEDVAYTAASRVIGRSHSSCSLSRKRMETRLPGRRADEAAASRHADEVTASRTAAVPG